jgi:hypothetical protein
MRRLYPYLAMATTLVALGLPQASSSWSAEPPGPFVLFDGKTLDGWKPTDFGKTGDVRVEGGTIVMDVGRLMTGITSTRQDLPRTNYELSYEAQRLKGRDFFAAATFPVGKAYLTFVNGGWGGNVTGLSSIDGSDASENETSTYFKYADNTWYRFRIRVTDSAVKCWIDDKPIVAVEIADRQLGTRLESRASEPLGFATYDAAGALRKIEIRRIAP